MPGTPCLYWSHLHVYTKYYMMFHSLATSLPGEKVYLYGLESVTSLSTRAKHLAIEGEGVGSRRTCPYNGVDRRGMGSKKFWRLCSRCPYSGVSGGCVQLAQNLEILGLCITHYRGIVDKGLRSTTFWCPIMGVNEKCQNLEIFPIGSHYRGIVSKGIRSK